MSAHDPTGIEALEGFQLLTKTSEGDACVMVIKQVLKHPSIYVFGELLDEPNIQALANTPHQPYLDLLKLFAYGTYKDYQQKQSSLNLPTLTDVEKKKLQQLSIVSLAGQNKRLRYEVLMSELGIDSLRELEDLVIDSIYQGLIGGNLDQHARLFVVQKSIGRDIGPTDVQEMMQKLQAWQEAARLSQQALLAAVERAEKHAIAKKKEEEGLIQEKEAALNAILLNDKDNAQDGMAGGMLGNLMGGMRGKKPKKHNTRMGR